MAAAAPSAQRWLFGPAPDLLLGCGLLYALMFVVFAGVGPEIRAQQAAYLFPLLLMLVSMPHYGGTLLRVYERRQDRRGYVIFSVYATLFVFALFVAGLHYATLGSWLFTLYVSWSPWHYTGQNYGLAVMFLRRRGIAVASGEKRLLYASFGLSFLLTFLVMHGAENTGGDTLIPYAPGSRIDFRSLAIPSSVAGIAIPVVGLAYLVTLAASAVLLLRRASARDLLPTALLALTQALWFSIPLAARYWHVLTGVDPIGWQFRGHYFMWIAIGHSAQYLWVTTYFARSSPSWHGTAPYLAKTLIAGVAIWRLPQIVFAPDALGPISYDAGLALLVASAVNIHHFILDGAIWKLRNSRIAGVLIRSAPEPAGAAAETGNGRGSWLRSAVWSVAGVALACNVFVFWQKELRYAGAVERGDHSAASAILDRLKWFGNDDWFERIQVARLMARDGQVQAAMAQYQRSVELRARPAAWAELGWLRQEQGDWSGASQAYEEALGLAPGHLEILERAIQARRALGDEARADELQQRLDASPARSGKGGQGEPEGATGGEAASAAPEPGRRAY